MSFAAPIFLATCTYTLGVAYVCISKQETYDHLHVQLGVIKRVKDETLDSTENNPGKLALIGEYYAPNGEAFSRKSKHLNNC